MRKPSRAENRFYLILALLLAFGTCVEVAYIDGHTFGAAQQKNAHEDLLQHEAERGDYWQAKYQALADETDGVTVIAAEMKFQKQGE